MRFLVRLIVTALAVVIAAYILPGVKVDGGLTAIVVALVLSLLNAFIKPLLIILTIPITVVTLGLFLLVINALIIIATDKLVDGFEVNGFWYALLFSIVLTVVVSLLNRLVKEEDRREA